MTERRDAIKRVILDRLTHAHQNGVSPLDNVAGLIADDLLSSPEMVAIINRSIENGMEAGREKGLRDAIMAVGNMERQLNEAGDYRHVDYENAQRAIAEQSTRGLEELWPKQTT